MQITGMISDFIMVWRISGLMASGSPTKPRSSTVTLPDTGSVLVSASFLATTMLPSLPDRPTARPPAALMAVTMCLLIEPVRTISTTSTAASSVTRKPSMKRDWISSFLSMAPILAAAAMHHHRIDAGLLHQDDVLGEIVGAAGAGHGVAAILHHDGLLVVFENEGQGFDHNVAGLAPTRHQPQILFFAVIRHLGKLDKTGALYAG